jgi:hypothetical protein
LKIAQFLEKVAKTVAKPRNVKISTAKLNLKFQNICIKPLLKFKITYNKPCFETAYSGLKIIILFIVKSSPKSIFGLLKFPKNAIKLAKNCPFGSP